MIELEWWNGELEQGRERTMSFLWGPTDGDVSDPAGWVLSSAKGVPEEMFDEAFDATHDAAVADPQEIDKLCDEMNARHVADPA